MHTHIFGFLCSLGITSRDVITLTFLVKHFGELVTSEPVFHSNEHIMIAFVKLHEIPIVLRDEPFTMVILKKSFLFDVVWLCALLVFITFTMSESLASLTHWCSSPVRWVFRRLACSFLNCSADWRFSVSCLSIPTRLQGLLLCLQVNRWLFQHQRSGPESRPFGIDFFLPPSYCAVRPKLVPLPPNPLRRANCHFLPLLFFPMYPKWLVWWVPAPSTVLVWQLLLLGPPLDCWLHDGQPDQKHPWHCPGTGYSLHTLPPSFAGEGLHLPLMYIAVSVLPRNAVASSSHWGSDAWTTPPRNPWLARRHTHASATCAAFFCWHIHSNIWFSHCASTSYCTSVCGEFCVTGFSVFLYVHFSSFSLISRACPRLSSSISWKRPFLRLSVPRCIFLCFSQASLHACLLLFHVLDKAFLERLLLSTLRTTLSLKFFLSCSARFFCGRRQSGNTRSQSEGFLCRHHNKHGGQSPPFQ